MRHSGKRKGWGETKIWRAAIYDVFIWFCTIDIIFLIIRWFTGDSKIALKYLVMAPLIIFGVTLIKNGFFYIGNFISNKVAHFLDHYDESEGEHIDSETPTGPYGEEKSSTGPYGEKI